MSRWYLIHTKPSGEKIAQLNLERQGYEVYFPRVIRPVRRSAQWREQVVALFPRYIFLRLNEGVQALSPVHSTSGVTGVVRFGSRYAMVPEEIIEDLRSRADSESGLHRLGCRRLFEPGTAVRVTMGPFDGLEGVFQREAGADRVVVLLRLLGQYATVCIPAGFLLPSHAS